MNHAHAILKNTAVLGLSELIEKASTIYLGIFVARSLGASGLGVYSAAMVYFGLLFLTAEIGSTTYLVREIAKDHSQTSRYVVNMSVMSGVLAMALVAISRAVVPLIGYSRDLESSLYVIMWAVVPAILRAIQESVLVVYQRVEFLTYSSLLAAILNVGISLYLLSRGFGVVSLVVAFAIVQCVVTSFYFVVIHRYIAALHWDFDRRFAYKILTEIKAFAGSSLLQGFLSRPEILILSLTKNDAQIGFYGAALKIIDLWQLIPRCYMTNVFPVLSSYYHRGDVRSQLLRDRSIKYLLAMSFPLTVGIFVLAGPAVDLLYGAAFRPSVSVLRAMVWVIPLGSLWAVLWRVLSARGQQDRVLGGQVGTIVVRLGGGYMLIQLLAAVGAAISTSVSMLLLNLFLTYQIHQDGSRLKLFHLAGRSAAAATCMGLVTLALRHYLNLWELVPLSAAVYVVMVFLFKVFSADDLAFLRKGQGVASTSSS